MHLLRANARGKDENGIGNGSSIVAGVSWLEREKPIHEEAKGIGSGATTDHAFMHVADGVTDPLASRSENDGVGEPATVNASVQLLILRHDQVDLDGAALDGRAHKAGKEDIIFQVHVPDEIVGEFSCASVKRAP